MKSVSETLINQNDICLMTFSKESLHHQIREIGREIVNETENLVDDGGSIFVDSTLKKKQNNLTIERDSEERVEGSGLFGENILSPTCDENIHSRKIVTNKTFELNLQSMKSGNSYLNKSDVRLSDRQILASYESSAQFGRTSTDPERYTSSEVLSQHHFIPEH